MINQAKRLQLLSVVLCIFVALLFSLTWSPNVIHVNTEEGFFPSNYYNLMGNDIFNILSGILLGGSLIPLIMFATRPSYRLISVSAVMLEIAAFFGLYQFVSAYLYPPGSYTPLGHMIEAGALFATVFAFLLQRKVLFKGKESIISQKQMALISLAIAFIFGLAFLKRCWRWDFGDEEIAFANFFDSNWNIGWFSEVLTVVALNISLLYSFGLLKGGSISCAVFLLVAAAMTSIGMIESYIPSDYSRVTCRPLPLTYLITAAQLVIAIHIFIEEHRIKRS